MGSTVAQKRLFQEYRLLTQDPPEGITAGPVNEDDMFVWEALIQGPEDTPFEGGIFPAELKFPKVGQYNGRAYTHRFPTCFKTQYCLS